MPVLTESELHSEIRGPESANGSAGGLGGQARAVGAGLRAAEEVIYQRFSQFEVSRPAVDLKRWDFGAMKNG